MRLRIASGKILLPIVILMILLAQMPVVEATNNQGLEWGVEIDDRFDYDVTLNYHNATYDLTIDDGMYVIIDDLPVIPDDVSSAAQLTFLDFTTYWDNGTEMTHIWKDIVMFIPFYLLPIGNWTLLSELREASTPQAEFYEDETILRVTVTIDDDYNITQDILKSDGTLAYQHLEWSRPYPVDTIELTMTQDGYEAPSESTETTTTSSSTVPPALLDNTLLLALGAVAGGIVVIAAVVCIRKKQ